MTTSGKRRRENCPIASGKMIVPESESRTRTNDCVSPANVPPSCERHKERIQLAMTSSSPSLIPNHHVEKDGCENSAEQTTERGIDHGDRLEDEQTTRHSSLSLSSRTDIVAADGAHNKGSSRYGRWQSSQSFDSASISMINECNRYENG